MTGEEIARALDAAGSTLPPAPPGSWQEAFQARTVPVEGGHLVWKGATTGPSGTPVLAFGGQVETAYRLSFRWGHGREPEGNVRPRCAYARCVAGEHLTDRRMRERGRA